MPDLRMPDINRVELAGNLTRDPELKYLPSGTALCQFGIAVTERFKKDGQKQERTDFFNCQCWKQSAEYLAENAKKGDPVLVEGKLKMEEWTDKASGQKRTAVKVNALRVQQLSWTGYKSAEHDAARTAQARPKKEIPEPECSDDLPF